ncbi:hypothetical protein DNI29_21090 [Hymenobacter sediminis]|uniref:hypothetical protein n=1 Tax=Hymenobacter sediminis TaxID=2218621 RepID=UPI000F511EC7|nr:hypothetical protein [Hymenobacter sediminis]RPD44627.1 hypothetical protein DNI29_21090 [Hymenobacter sediminis]
MSHEQGQVLHKWDTPCAEASELYFHRLLDSGEQICFFVTNREAVYEFCFEQSGPYQVADEAHLAVYQTNEYDRPDNSVSSYWTYTVVGSPWAALFNQATLAVSFADYTHYCIMTYDGCLDILSRKPPIISMVKLPIKK